MGTTENNRVEKGINDEKVDTLFLFVFKNMKK